MRPLALIAGILRFFSRRNFFQADISSATFSEVKGAASAFNLAESFVHEPTRLFERCTRRTLDVWLDWERLRSIGRVPIFAPSALVLVFIPLFLYFLARYNSVLHPLIEWAHQAGADPTAAGNLFASHLIDSGLAEVTPPSQLLWTLIATLLLLMGSTIFFFGCPAEVKEFSRNQWIHEHKKDLTHYWPKSWRYPAARVLCASFYGAGGVIAILILVTKFIHVARYVIEHTPHPWYLF